ncbi:hypothetical protein GCK72_011847 [Caenorhabditis remanei]|uniref:Uncharacterized protein n=1 Tax=Caenorhabditis remanei TaxID=31234 RepID=A0A6A5H6X3_CAERE|nr:hypothetical protein GCK72_011847 [Caenorhabditis remanei]KAF1763580.1 hypothetical protein GCK72_011847 [Caenorhabditis remanei]
MACHVEGDQKVQVGSYGAIEMILDQINRKHTANICDDVMEVGWSFLWNITDETPVNCELFLNANGLDLFQKCYEAFKSERELVRNINNSTCAQLDEEEQNTHVILSKILSPLQKLEVLDLSYWSKTDDMRCLQPLSNTLTCLILYDVPDLYHAISNICHMTEIRILDKSQSNRDTGMYPHPVTTLNKMVVSLPHMTHLDISSTNLATQPSSQDNPARYRESVRTDICEIWEGHNFADFVDPEIQQKLLKEEELLEEAGEYESDLDSDDEETKEKMSQALQIRKKEKLLTLEHTVNKRIARLEHGLGEMGVDIDTKKMKNLQGQP